MCLQDNRSFQMASVEQQNLLIDHLNRLNQWLTGDQQDRQNEMRGIYARVDQLREDLNRLYQGMPTFLYNNASCVAESVSSQLDLNQ